VWCTAQSGSCFQVNAVKLIVPFILGVLTGFVIVFSVGRGQIRRPFCSTTSDKYLKHLVLDSKYFGAMRL